VAHRQTAGGANKREDAKKDRNRHCESEPLENASLINATSTPANLNENI